MSREIMLMENKEGNWQEPFATICIESKEEFDKLNKALEKQIPKKVDTTGSGDDDFYICPVCKERLESIDAFVLLKEPYCSNCGQKLDWGD